ncbi:uncharacterized protein L201_002952 [Kwoniella dendrophila CBS 6074]|uniref:Uncharacterized protein n=1 Tax=Kwoniella dendrophila CBS 6074 TaxID=1295534 RepID=A0AAX4JS10_9TREE
MAAISSVSYVNKGCETSSDGSCSTHGSSGCTNNNSMPVNQCNTSGTNGACSTCGASSSQANICPIQPVDVVVPVVPVNFLSIHIPPSHDVAKDMNNLKASMKSDEDRNGNFFFASSLFIL